MNRFTIDLPVAELTFRSKKLNRETKIAIADLPNESLWRIIRYGAQRIVNDAVNSGTDYDEMIERIRTGNFPRGGGKAGDPVAAECRRLIEDALRRAGLMT